MDNKYHDIMSRVEVTDEMRARILQNISEEVKTAPKGRVDNSLVKRKAKITTIIGVVAACGIVLAAGGFIISIAARGGNRSAEAIKDEPAKLDNLDIELADDEGGVRSYAQSNGNHAVAFGTEAYETTSDQAEPGADYVTGEAAFFILYEIPDEVSLQEYEGKTYRLDDGVLLNEIAEVMSRYTFVEANVPLSDCNRFIFTIDGIVHDVQIGDGFLILDGKGFTYSSDSRTDLRQYLTDLLVIKGIQS